MQHTPTVHLILWGKNFITTTPGTEVHTMLTELFDGLSKPDAYQGILTQYFDSTGRIAPEMNFPTPYIDETESAPTSVNETKVEQEIAKAIEANKWSVEQTAQFVVVTAPGSTYENGFLSEGCAYHGFTSAKIVYDFIPYQGDPPFSGGCLSFDAQHNPVHKTSKSVSHEYAEAATDPELNAWQAASGAEIGDLCEGFSDRELIGHAWVQPEYDDHLGGCTYEDLNPPHVYAITDSGSNVTKHEATLNATVNPEGLETGYHFEYGTTTSYGKNAPASSETVGSGVANKAVSQKISGLRPETVYHYRVVATNSSGTSYGEDQTVTPTQWTIGELLTPAGASETYPDDISCTSPEWCMFVGLYQGGSNSYSESWNGSQWSEHSLRLPGQRITGLSTPVDVAADSKGNIWATERGSHRVDEFSPGGELLRQFGGEGIGPGQFKEPWGVALAPNGMVWVVDHGNDRIEEFKANGEFVAQFGASGSGEGQFREPQGMAIDPSGNVWVADGGNNRIQEYSPTQNKIILTFGSGGSGNGQFSDPAELAIASDGSLWVTDRGNNRVDEFSSAGAFTRTFGWGVKDGNQALETCTSSESCRAGTSGYGSGQLYSPAGIAIDEQGHLWVVNNGYNAPIEEFEAEPTEVKNVVTFGSFYFPWGAVVADGSLFTVEDVFGVVQPWALPTSEGSTPVFTEGGSLPSVSCTSTSACTAVASYRVSSGVLLPLAERWNGTAWQVQSVPGESGAKETALLGVSCISSSECTAVGYATNSSGTTVPYAARWNGSSWSPQSVPAPPEGGPVTALLRVSCTSTNACMAVGRTKGQPAQTESGTGFAESWDGSTWSAVSPKTPTGLIKGLLTGVSCTSASACVAVGDYFGTHPPSFSENYWGAWIERWNGTEWREQEHERASGFQDDLKGVSCSTPESCTAVGAFEIRRSHWVSLVETWNGVTWRHQNTPTESNVDRTELLSVSCVLESTCATVGAIGSSTQQLAETRPETEMGVQATPTPSHATHVVLSGSACVSSTACAEVGSYANSSGTTVSLAEAWNGFEWKAQPTENPVGAKATELRRVSCTSPSACTAVGSYRKVSGLTVTLAENWNGTKWTLQTTPNPEKALESRLTGVSCTSSTSCSAVGFYKNSSGTIESLAENWNGTVWTIQKTQNPSGATGARLLGVSCSATGLCTAVGSYTNSASETLSLAERLNGSEWEPQGTQNPSGGKGVELSGVSCPQATACTAVGSYTNASGNAAILAEGWNGTWQLQATQTPAGAVQSKTLGVSCTALGTCTAVGWSKQGTGNATPLAELWNGREWLPWSAPSPSSEGGELQDISCVSMYACEAAGTYTNSSKVQVSLAEGLGAPGASTRPATSITSSTATLAGIVAFNQWTSTYHFEYGETTSYGTSVPVPDVGLLTEAGEVVQQVATNLKSKTTYHFRLVATNFAGTTSGEDRTFTTP